MKSFKHVLVLSIAVVLSSAAVFADDKPAAGAPCTGTYTGPVKGEQGAPAPAQTGTPPVSGVAKPSGN
jgi:hypothetical protein